MFNILVNLFFVDFFGFYGIVELNFYNIYNVLLECIVINWCVYFDMVVYVMYYLVS